MLHVLQWTMPALLSFAVAYFFYGRKRRDEQKADEIERDRKHKETTDERIHELELKLEQMVPVAEAFRAMLIAKMTHLHTPRLDYLMARIDFLSEFELTEMFGLINDRITVVDGLIDQEEREAAAIFPAVHRMVMRERDVPDAETVIQVVTIPKPVS